MQRNHPLLANNLTNNGPVLFMLAGKGKKRRRLQRDERYRKFCERKEARDVKRQPEDPHSVGNCPPLALAKVFDLNDSELKMSVLAKSRKIANMRGLSRRISCGSCHLVPKMTIRSIGTRPWLARFSSMFTMANGKSKSRRSLWNFEKKNRIK